jgi:hypothetical protein
MAVATLKNKLLLHSSSIESCSVFTDTPPMHDRPVDITMHTIQQCVHARDVYPDPVP